MKQNLKLGIILGIITSLAGLFLGLSNNLTKDAIAKNSLLTEKELTEIMPMATIVEESDKDLDGDILEILEGKNSGNEVVGYLFQVTTKGFHGAINLMVGISQEGAITGLKIIAHSETAGLGAKIAEEVFTSRFQDISTENKISITKSSPTSDNEVEGVSGATISSKAVASAVNEAINYFRVNIKGESAIKESNTDATSEATTEQESQTDAASEATTEQESQTDAASEATAKQESETDATSEATN